MPCLGPKQKLLEQMQSRYRDVVTAFGDAVAQRTIATERSDSLMLTIKSYESQLKALADLPDEEPTPDECGPSD